MTRGGAAVQPNERSQDIAPIEDGPVAGARHRALLRPGYWSPRPCR